MSSESFFCNIEDEIISNFDGCYEKPKVSFLCITYNQERYIEKTLIGFLNQKTKFPFEILVHDDCSNDGTRVILEKYRRKYPRLIKCIFQEENQYSKGIDPLLIAARHCNGDYIAICEGDDYWIDDSKVENQLNKMLEKDVSMIASPGWLEVNGKISKKTHCHYGEVEVFFTAQEILNVPGQFLPTASYMLKKNILIDALTFFNKTTIKDLYIEIYAALNGGLLYYPCVSSVYRVQADSSWSKKMRESGELIVNLKKYKKELQKSIEHSLQRIEFLGLNWDSKLAAVYLGIAVAYLEENNIKEFLYNIKISYNLKKISKSQTILFNIGMIPFAAKLILKPAVHIKKLLSE